ncbi:MAG: HAD family phosphatase [Patescibacteria group bacterium]
MIKAIIFDMDGLLIDSEPVAKRTTLALMKEYGVTFKGDTGIFLGLRNVDILKIIKKRYKIQDPLPTMLRKMTRQFLDRAHSIKLMPGFAKLKKVILKQDWKRGLATSANRANVRFLLKKHKLLTFFHGKVTAEMVKKGKPHPEVYKIIARKLGVRPADCLVLEDSVNGMLAAKRAGMKCIVVRSAQNRKMKFDRADAIVNSLADIKLDLIQKI